MFRNCCKCSNSKNAYIFTQYNVWCARFIAAIEDMPKKDLADNKAIGEAGADAILTLQERDCPVRVLTHCNTGSLATSAYGTALGVIRSLHARDKLGIRHSPTYLTC